MIKVRAWHKNLKCFVGDDCSWIHYGPRLGEGELSSPDHDIELFSGLHDFKGVEIYAGDIIDSIKFPDDDPEPAQMIFEDGSFRYKYKDWSEGLAKPLLTGRDIKLMHYVVVGNIHENPELIGG